MTRNKMLEKILEFTIGAIRYELYEFYGSYTNDHQYLLKRQGNTVMTIVCREVRKKNGEITKRYVQGTDSQGNKYFQSPEYMAAYEEAIDFLYKRDSEKDSV